MQILERYLHMVLLMEMEKKDEFLFSKKVRRLGSIIILVGIVAMVATMVIPYLV